MDRVDEIYQLCIILAGCVHASCVERGQNGAGRETERPETSLWRFVAAHLWIYRIKSAVAAAQNRDRLTTSHTKNKNDQRRKSNMDKSARWPQTISNIIGFIIQNNMWIRISFSLLRLARAHAISGAFLERRTRINIKSIWWWWWWCTRLFSYCAHEAGNGSHWRWRQGIVFRSLFILFFSFVFRFSFSFVWIHLLITLFLPPSSRCGAHKTHTLTTWQNTRVINMFSIMRYVGIFSRSSSYSMDLRDAY